MNEQFQILERDRNWKNRKKAYDNLGKNVDDRSDYTKVKRFWSKESGRDRSRLEDSATNAIRNIERRLGIRSVDTTSPTEVSSASEDALLLELIETQSGTIKLLEEKVELKSSGKFLIKNLGEDDRIWDIDVTVRSTGNSNLEEQYLVPELAPQGEWEKEYTIEGGKKITDPEFLPFEYKELINTQTDQEEANSVLVFGKEMEANITYTFTAKKNIEEIVVTKELLGHFTNPKVGRTSAGNAKIEDSGLVWKIPTLESGEEATLEFTTVINVEDVEPKRSGTVNIKSISKAEGAYSGVDIGKADGFTKNIVYIDADEMEEEPDTWECNLVFKNPSEFPIELHRVKIWALGDDEDDDNLDEGAIYFDKEFEENELIVNAGGEWVTPEPWTHKSTTVPKFKKEVLFTVKPEIMYKSASEIDVTDMEMPVARLVGVKKYGIEVLPSFRETPVPTMLRFANTGSLQLKETTIIDEIPEGLEAPDSDEVKVYVIKTSEGAHISDDVPDDSYQISDYSVDFSDRNLNVKITQQIEPNEVIYLYYEAMAAKPKAEDRFKGEGHLIATLTVPAPPLEIDVVDWLSTDEITVAHLRRKVTSGKNVFPGSEEGVYDISILFKNRGELDLDNVTVRDFLPEGFSIISEERDSQSIPADEGEIRVWKLEKLEAGEEIIINYSIQGSGEYKVSKAQVSY